MSRLTTEQVADRDILFAHESVIMRTVRNRSHHAQNATGTRLIAKRFAIDTIRNLRTKKEKALPVSSSRAIRKEKSPRPCRQNRSLSGCGVNV